MTEAEAFRRLEETCSLGHGNTVRKRRDCMTCQVLLLVEASITISDIHARDADEIERLTAESNARRETILTLSDERRTEWVRAENAEAEVTRLARTVDRKDEQMAELQEHVEKADRFKYLWELEAGRATKAEGEGFFDKLEKVRYQMALQDIEARFTGYETLDKPGLANLMDVVRAALSPAPAQPATPQRVHCRCIGGGDAGHWAGDKGCSRSQPATAAKESE